MSEFTLEIYRDDKNKLKAYVVDSKTGVGIESALDETSEATLKQSIGDAFGTYIIKHCNREKGGFVDVKNNG